MLTSHYLGVILQSCFYHCEEAEQCPVQYVYLTIILSFCQWVPLSEAKSGRIHVRATWLDLNETASSLDLVSYFADLLKICVNFVYTCILVLIKILGF